MVVWVPLAYLLINAEEYDSSLTRKLKAIKGVEQAHPVYGVYDIIVVTRADTMDKLKEIHDRIRKLEKVRSTLTMVAHEG
jgi:DNA-binding Lrp family transcriptional regulator